jgi:hypothetical protein
MTSWVLTIDSNYPQHWDIAKQNGFWDMTAHRDVIQGDLLYFWLAKGSLLGQARATSDAVAITPLSKKPWDDAGVRYYSWRFTFELLDDHPTSLPAWGEIQKNLSKAYTLQAPRRLTDPADESVLASYFGEVSLEDYSLSDHQREAELAAMGYDMRRFEYRAIAVRQGQAKFRSALLSAYGGCPVTGTTAAAVLEAAHISPHKGDPTNQLYNGLLLRADVHTLFDLFRITVTPDHVIRVAPELLDSDYGQYDAAALKHLPVDPKQRPESTLLRSHNDRCSWLGQ